MNSGEKSRETMGRAGKAAEGNKNCLNRYRCYHTTVTDASLRAVEVKSPFWTFHSICDEHKILLARCVGGCGYSRIRITKDSTPLETSPFKLSFYSFFCLHIDRSGNARLLETHKLQLAIYLTPPNGGYP